MRLEDIGPGGDYGTPEGLAKLRAVADYLHEAGVPFHIALISRFVNPSAGTDVSLTEPGADAFKQTLDHLEAQGGSVGLHGYTHQYGNSISGPGSEFSYSGCTTDCPPDDAASTLNTRATYQASYVSSRIGPAVQLATNAGYSSHWFESPHYQGSSVQRELMEGWSGFIFENDPSTPYQRTVTVSDRDNAFSRGAVYVPTPLYYVDGSDSAGSVANMCAALDGFQVGELAGFFFHPYLEFDFIQLDGQGNVSSYSSQSWLHQLVACFQQKSFNFVRIETLTPFVPSLRQTDFFPGTDADVFAADANGDAVTDLIVRDSLTGNWSFVFTNLRATLRPQGPSTLVVALNGWGVGWLWTPLVGDFNGDHAADVAVRNNVNGSIQVALGNGSALVPNGGPAGDGIWLGANPILPTFTGDVNGDGRADLIFWDSNQGLFTVSLGQANHFDPPTTWLNGWAPTAVWDVLVGDVNGDGRADIVVRHQTAGSWQVALSNGTGFVPSPAGSGSYEWLSGWAAGSTWVSRIGDFNGDGKDDVAAIDPIMGSWRIAYTQANGFVPTTVFERWGGGASMIPLIGRFAGGSKAALCARHPDLRNGTIDFAVPPVP